MAIGFTPSKDAPHDEATSRHRLCYCITGITEVGALLVGSVRVPLRTAMSQHMEPTDICLRKVTEAAHVTDSTIIAKVADALDELEAAYAHPSDRIIALERVFSEFGRRRPSVHRTPTARLIRVSIERRQIRCNRSRA